MCVCICLIYSTKRHTYCEGGLDPGNNEKQMMKEDWGGEGWCGEVRGGEERGDEGKSDIKGKAKRDRRRERIAARAESREERQQQS